MPPTPPALVGCLAKVKWTHLVDSHVMGNQIRLNVRQKAKGWLAVVKMAVLSTRQSSPNINGESDSIEKLNQLPSIVGENVERELFLFKDNLLRFFCVSWHHNSITRWRPKCGRGLITRRANSFKKMGLAAMRDDDNNNDGKTKKGPFH